MDLNSSGSGFCWPDAGGSWPETEGLHEQGPEPGMGGRAPTLKPRGGRWIPTLHPRLPWQGMVPTSGLVMSAWHDCFWHRQEGHACLLTQSYAFLYFFFFLFTWISRNFTCKPLATKWIVIYSELLATPSNQGKPQQNRNQQNLWGLL